MNKNNYKEVLNNNGYIVGYKGSIELNNLKMEIYNKFKVELQSAKSIYISIEVNPEKSLFEVSDIQENIFESLFDNVESTFNISTNDNLLITKCNYEILLIGLDTIN